MAAYVKSHYNGKIHLLTANYAGAIVPSDDIFKDPNMDVMTSNIYDYKAPDFANHYIKNVSGNYLNEAANHYTSYSKWNEKPLIFAETDPIEASCDYNSIEIKRSMFQSMFSGLAGSISWDLRKHPELFINLSYMRNFIENFELETERWHPGSSDIVDFSDQRTWQYNSDYADDMDGDKNGNQRLADLSYLRSWDGNYCIGVITNKTYNVYTMADCFDQTWQDSSLNSLPDVWEWKDPITDVSTIETEDEKLKLRNLTAHRYYIDYFKPNNLTTPYASSDNMGPKVKIQCTIPKTSDGYILFFKARRKNYSWIDDIQDEQSNSIVRQFNYETNILTINEESGNNDASVFPVPSSDKIIIRFKQFDETIAVNILSCEGKNITKFKLEYNEFEYDISNFENGTYWIHFEKNNQVFLIKKFVKI